jgi:hypothetical protein
MLSEAELRVIFEIAFNNAEPVVGLVLTIGVAERAYNVNV